MTTESPQDEPAPALAYYHGITGAQYAGIRRLVILLAVAEGYVNLVSHIAVLADPAHQLPLRYAFLPASLYFNALYFSKVLETICSIGVIFGGVKLLSDSPIGRPAILISECAAMFFDVVFRMMHTRESWLEYSLRNTVQSFSRNTAQSFSLPCLLVIQLGGLLYDMLIPLFVLAVLLRFDPQPNREGRHD
jgi:hypothetical protein